MLIALENTFAQLALNDAITKKSIGKWSALKINNESLSRLKRLSKAYNFSSIYNGTEK